MDLQPHCRHGQSTFDRLHLLNKLVEGSQANEVFGTPPSARHSVLRAFVQSSQPSSGERVWLPQRLTCVPWALIFVDTALGSWLVTVFTGDSCRDGSIRAVATLGNHPGVLLARTATCMIGPVVLITSTHGSSQCIGTHVVTVAVASAAGGAAL
jgi:hypothetical protein